MGLGLYVGCGWGGGLLWIVFWYGVVLWVVGGGCGGDGGWLGEGGWDEEGCFGGGGWGFGLDFVVMCNFWLVCIKDREWVMVLRCVCFWGGY